jgi:cysteine desulfurase
MTRIYLDHNATTPVDPDVADAVARAMRDEFGNPSSVHAFGQKAKTLLDGARSSVAALIGGDASEVVFTSGGTEADNLAVRGIAEGLEQSARRHLVASAIEHEAVLNTVKALARRGWTATLVPAGPDGVVSPDAVRAAMTPATALVSIMHANNETGVIQPIAELAAIAREHGARFHTDAVQSAGKIPVDVRALGADLVSVSAHKFYGPKGTGALWIRRGTRLGSLLAGGRQERNRRAGTENVPAIVGFGIAADRAIDKMAAEAIRQAALRDLLESSVVTAVPGCVVNGTGPRVPNTTNISFDGVEAESLLIALDLEGIAVSTGSACSSGTLEPSHVLRAMGLPPHRAESSIRFSLGQSTTTNDIERVAAVLPRLVEKLRGLLQRSARAHGGRV